MSLFLGGIRMAFAGGRESVARTVLMAIGVAVGVVLLLVTLSGLPIIQSHLDRLAWHRTTSPNAPAAAPTAPDPASWIAVTDRYAGQDIIRVHVAALGPRPPVPPGVDRLPGPGEVFVSPALAKLMATVPDDQLRGRFPGRIAGTIGLDGLVMPDELVAIVGHTPEEMRKSHGAQEIRGIEQPGDRLDLAAFWGILFGMVAVLLIGPVVVFVSMVTRIGGAQREQRFAALRLAGATRLQAAALAATETAGAAIAGTILGWLGYLAARPIVASQVTLGHGMPIFAQDVRVPTVLMVVTLLAVPLLAVATTLVALRPVQLTPLGVHQRGRRRPPRAWRLLPIAAGALGIWYAARITADPDYDEGDEVLQLLFGLLSLLSPLSILVGLFLSGAWVSYWISRGMAGLSSSATTLIVARRMAADPYSAFRSVSGAALAIFVATMLGFFAAGERASAANHDHPSSVLDAGVVAVHVRGAPEASLAPLMSDGVVVARLAPGRRIAVACADLTRITELTCPLPAGNRNDELGLDHDRLFALPHREAGAADMIFRPIGFVEPGPDADSFPIQTLFIPTDGTRAAQERVRTLAAVTVPFSRSKTSDDVAAPPALSVLGLETVLPYALVFVLVVAACSLTVSVINGVMERRRPFALLRASGVRLGELRRIVLLETGVPLAATVLGGVGLAVLIMYVVVPSGLWVWPSADFFAGLGAGVLLAFAVSLIALPLMDSATRHDSVRFE